MSIIEDARPSSRGLPMRKIGWIAGLVVATLLPDALLSQLVGERQDRATAAASAIGGAWGPPQVVAGPRLVWSMPDKTGASHHVELAPRSLDIRATIAPSLRHRGLFDAAVYEATVTMSGSFELPAGARAETAAGEAMIVVTLPGAQGLRDDDRVEIAGETVPWQACAEVLTDEPVCRGAGIVLVAEVDVAAAKPAGAEKDAMPFTLALHLRGTASLRVETIAKTAAVHIAGAWPTPGFIGGELPAASMVKDGAFSADWSINRVGRPRFQNVSTLGGTLAGAVPVGVELVEGAPVYRMISRIEKYGLVIVVLAFAAYFSFEVLTGAAIALLQYALLGAALTLFTLLLLSISEVAGYGVGYGASALLITAQASLYTWSVTGAARLAAIFAGLLGTVFGFFYVLVGLESYALLVGAAALFLVLSVVMGLTQAASVRGLSGVAG